RTDEPRAVAGVVAVAVRDGARREQARHVSERSVPVVPEEVIGKVDPVIDAARARTAPGVVGDIQIGVAVVVVVHPRRARAGAGWSWKVPSGCWIHRCGGPAWSGTYRSSRPSPFTSAQAAPGE